jgi:hypothetical protein
MRQQNCTFPWRGLVLTSLAALVLAGGTGRGAAQSAGPEVTLKVVKYDQLRKELESHKGSVVLVDVWGVT